VPQEHGDERRKEDIAYWVTRIVKKIDEANVGEENIVVDGLRNSREVEEMRKIFPRFFLVAVCAQKEERWSRVRSDYGGRFNEFEDDDRRDQNEDFKWGQSVQKCVDEADYVYYNADHHVVNLDGNENPDARKIQRVL
jgi:hypothetical protein